MVNELSVLIVAATARELQPLETRVADPSAAEGPRELRRGRLGDCPVITATCGVGKSNAAMHTLDLLRRHAVRLVINTGCAGAYPNKKLKTGDVVVGSAAIFADEGVLLTGDGFLDLREIGLPLGSDAAGDPIYNAVPATPVTVPDTARSFAVRRGVITTVSSGSASAERAEALGKLGLAEAMEGASVALAANEVGCPFVEIRGISNETGSRDLARWEIDLACAHAAEVVEDILRSAT